MGSCKKMMIMIVVVVAMVSMKTPAAQGQAPPDMPCLQALIPCTPALNSTGTPPNSCCGPLRDAFETQLPCICAVFQNTDLAEAANVNLTQVMQLPARCSINSDPSMCDGAEEASPASAPVAGGPTSPAFDPVVGGPTTSPGVASTPTATPGSSASSSVAWAGSLASFMLLLAGLMFY